jgi:hypothetical protein
MTRRAHPTRKKLLEAITNTGGVISRISEKLEYSWHATKAAIEADPVVMAAYEDECERINDLAESVLITKIIKDADGEYSKWWLKARRRAKFGDAIDVTTKGEKIGTDDAGIKSEILRKLDSIATATGTGSVPVQPDTDPTGNTGA